ncbi:hypothetical protein [Aureispira anguillae]|uniref:Uncharacterized protein n=1 Tax=Aureispira anguillae TaxID=2864201 RepID=A0A915YIX7_9BACT|nr:hypothetical protein [Aureispira anguillae]BDS13943.1 hypothetical protein AsAng_0047060 [Aureispira anguillae]
MFKQENYPTAAPYYLMNRKALDGQRQTVFIAEQKYQHVPAEVSYHYRKERVENEKTQLQQFVLASYLPLLLVAKTASGEDSEGVIVLITCCLIAFFLFGITGWKNEEIKNN